MILEHAKTMSYTIAPTTLAYDTQTTYSLTSWVLGQSSILRVTPIPIAK